MFRSVVLPGCSDFDPDKEPSTRVMLSGLFVTFQLSSICWTPSATIVTFEMFEVKFVEREKQTLVHWSGEKRTSL